VLGSIRPGPAGTNIITYYRLLNVIIVWKKSVISILANCVKLKYYVRPTKRKMQKRKPLYSKSCMSAPVTSHLMTTKLTLVCVPLHWTNDFRYHTDDEEEFGPSTTATAPASTEEPAADSLTPAADEAATATGDVDAAVAAASSATGVTEAEDGMI
jgi:hypothetical protein